MLASATKTPSDAWRLLAQETYLIPPDAYIEQTPSSLVIRPEFVALQLKRARARKLSVILAHSHPMGGPIQASVADVRGEELLLPVIGRRVPDVPHGRLIVGTEAYDSLLWMNGVEVGRLHPVDVGASVRGFPDSSAPELHSKASFDRQTRAFGARGQGVLSRTRVGIIGLGGTGSVVLQQLAHLGIGELLLIDPDEVDPSNLNRVVGSTPSDVGRAKVQVARELASRINPRVQVEVLAESVNLSRVLRRLLDVDVFFCCTDSQGSRAVLTQLAYQFLVPGFDLGVRIVSKRGKVSHITGRVQMLAPSLPCLVCGQILDSEEVRRDLLTDAQRTRDPYISGATVPEPAVISINSTVSSLAVTMFLSAFVGIPVKTRHQIIRFEAGTVRAVEGRQNPQCVVCSSSGAFEKGDAWPMPGRVL